ncbi:GntR family transcriptional regulator [Desulfosediminicola flagellatus]|uniref:GntR family transcriptional regulator n=1 Tax=Desulfosediminicola flagellatus TaxID=2569541 RepID=UPI0010ACF11B|nr:GntR family transcriptional regulator [Desulfosediminicola flagellatus]
MAGELQVSSLSEQVYTYLRKQMNLGDLLPGSTINIGEIAKQLGISKTPLRDALIHLELEGFVTILPRRGVRVNPLHIQDVKNAYDAIGLVEAFIVKDCIDKFTSAHIRQLEKLNKKMILDIEKDDFSDLFEANLEFHHTYLDISDNEPLKKFILPIKHRLYDFPRQNYIRDWELRNCEEHSQFIAYLKDGNGELAGKIMQEQHWSFEFQEDFIRKFYNMEGEPVK